MVEFRDECMFEPVDHEFRDEHCQHRLDFRIIDACYRVARYRYMPQVHSQSVIAIASRSEPDDERQMHYCESISFKPDAIVIVEQESACIEIERAV